MILTSCLINHSISALTHASCKGVLKARESWSFVFWQLLTAALYQSLSNEESGINEKKRRKKKRRKDLSCFTVFSAPVELNYVGTVICSLSARRWQIPVAQFERCGEILLLCSRPTHTVQHAPCKPQVPTVMCGFLTCSSVLLDSASSIPVHTVV